MGGFLLTSALLLAIVVILVDSSLRWDIVRKVSAVTLAETSPGTMPLPEGSFEEMLILPGSSMDARWWVLHTKELLREGKWRWRSTSRDNTPEGREVHWSSLPMWILAGLASVIGWLTDRPPESCVAEAALSGGPLLMVFFFGVLGLLTWRNFGWQAAFLMLAALISMVPIYHTFILGEYDHHGIVISFLLLGGLAWISAGMGYVSTKTGPENTSPLFPDEKTARFRFRLAGCFGAAALWISAATSIPFLVGMGVGALLMALLKLPDPGHTGAKFAFRPQLWQDWAWAGGVTSLFFYLLEYFPSHLGVRLEVNHPFYALAWIGGGYWISFFQRWRLGLAPRVAWHSEWGPKLAATTMLLLPVGAVLLFSKDVFWVADKFLLDLHREFITEFQNLPQFFAINAPGSRYVWIMYFFWPALLTGLGALWYGKKKASLWGWTMLTGLLPLLIISTALGFYQIRWFPLALSTWALFALILAADFKRASPPTARWLKLGLQAGAVLGVIFALGPQALIRQLQFETCTRAPIPQDFGNGIILRDIAHRLLHSSPHQLPVVLTGPNSSTHLTYHSGIKTLGTLYWENMPGLKRAAEIFSAPDEASALKLLQEAGVTHIVLPSWDNFAQAYTSLLATAKGHADNEAPFFQAIVNGTLTPQWLRPFCYPIPSGSGLDANSVKIFAFLPQQNAFEAAFFRGVYHFEAGEFPAAAERFQAAQRLRPSDPRPAAFLQQILRNSLPAPDSPP